jgi:predicted  nucleic acid-binding Zn-ribbon protein
MARNHRSVSQQLKEVGQYYESSVQEYERKLQAAFGPHPGQNMKQGEMREYQTAQAEANDKLTAAKQELNEMREMKRDYQSRLGEAHGQLDTCQQNMGKLHKEKEDLIRKHREALGAAEDREAIAKKKIIELEEKQSYEQLILGERVIELEKKMDSIREHRDALSGAWEAAEKKIAKLEKEKAGLIQEHRDALATAEEAAEKRIVELEKEKAGLMQECRDALAAAEDRTMVVAERIAEPEKKNVSLI